MGAAASLLGYLHGWFGKTYIFAGLLPALVLILTLHLYWGGLPKVRALVGDLGTALAPSDGKEKSGSDEKPATQPTTRPDTDVADAAGEAVFRLVVLAMTGVMFFAARHLTLELFRSLPGFLLALPRRILLSHNERAYDRAHHNVLRLEARLTLLAWAETEFGPMAFPSAEINAEALGDSLDACRQQRERLGRLSAAKPGARLTNDDVNGLIAGLATLYVYAQNHPQDNALLAEVANWKTLLGVRESGGRCRTCVGRIKSIVRREHARALANTRRFPAQAAWLAPTRLGNRLASLDDYAEQRYGIDTSLLLPRLWPVIPAEDRNEILDAQVAVQAMLNLCLAVLIAAGYVAVGNARESYDALRGAGLRGNWHTDWRSVAFLAAFVLLALMFYHAAIFALFGYVERVTRAVDLYRLRVIRALGFASPHTKAEEHELFTELRRFFGQADAHNRTFRARQLVDEAGAKPAGDPDAAAKRDAAEAIQNAGSS